MLANGGCSFIHGSQVSFVPDDIILEFKLNSFSGMNSSLNSMDSSRLHGSRLMTSKNSIVMLGER